MYIRKSSKFGKQIKIIHPGEFYISDRDEIIGTLLGSCIAVCLYDTKKKMAGMNHFMLPGKISKTDIFEDRSARYGITAMHKIFSKMEQAGAVKSDLIAKVFGGGHVLEDVTDMITIPLDNIRLAKIMLEIEDVPIVQMDVGSKYTRKILMEVETGKVYLKKSTREDVYKEVAEREKQFVKSKVDAS